LLLESNDDDDVIFSEEREIKTNAKVKQQIHTHTSEQKKERVNE